MSKSIIFKREKTFNINQRNLVKEINNIFKNNPKLILKDKNLIALLNLKLDGDGNIISKNKSTKELLAAAKRQGGLFDIEHITDVATEKKSIQYPINRQITTLIKKCNKTRRAEEDFMLLAKPQLELMENIGK